ncbi:unnamed protein product [Strongylus vulgaris]|uniref:Uncharacterized protein n=1 Tax=Strongylus vulgaris TaxID=40348 RepID=A0A3P7L2J1_STRVU|nr:unnamed protein product [Strongylus vulgaris]
MGDSRNQRCASPASERFGNNRFSVPNAKGPQHPDPYYAAERGAPPPPGYPSPHDPVYGSNFENKREEYMPRDWNERDMDESTRRDPRRQPNNEGRYPQTRGSDDDRRQRRFSIPSEPKKFECKHVYLMNTTDVPTYENVGRFG